MNVNLITYTPEPEKVIACAGKLCYSKSDPDKLMDGMTDEKAGQFVEMLAGMGHATPLEMASFTFSISGISRSCLAQISRHRIASMNVRSQRYVGMDDARQVVPPAILNNEECLEIYQDTASFCSAAYERITRILQNEYMIQGMGEKAGKKKAQEDARFILPEGTETSMLLTMNARELQHFFSLRCCDRAQWEIRDVATQMYSLVYPLAPHLFEHAGPACVACGKCPEGAMSCGKAKEMQEKFELIKKETKETNTYGNR